MKKIFKTCVLFIIMLSIIAYSNRSIAAETLNDLKSEK